MILWRNVLSAGRQIVGLVQENGFFDKNSIEMVGRLAAPEILNMEYYCH